MKIGFFGATVVILPSVPTTPSFIVGERRGCTGRRRDLSGRRPSSLRVSAPTAAITFVIEASWKIASVGIGVPAALSRKP